MSPLNRPSQSPPPTRLAADEAVGAKRRRQRLLTGFAAVSAPLVLLYILLPGRFGVANAAAGSEGVHQWLYAPAALLAVLAVGWLARTRWYRVGAGIAITFSLLSAIGSLLLVLDTEGLGFEAGLAVGFLPFPALIAAVFLRTRAVAIVAIASLLVAVGVDLGTDSALYRSATVQAVVWPLLIALLIVRMQEKDRAELIAQHEGLVRLLDAAAEPIVVLEDDGAAWTNRAFERTFPDTQDEALGILRDSAQSIGSTVARLKTRGEDHLFQIAISRIEGGDRQATILQLHDVHAQEAKRAASMVRDRLSTIGLLAGGVAHEANTPLTYLTLNLHLALDAVREGGGAEAIEELLVDCQQGAEALAQIHRDLGSVSRVNDSELLDVSVRDVVETSLRLVRGSMMQDASFEVEGGDAVVRATPTRLGQVMLNLFTNAVAANRASGRRNVRIELSQPEPDWVEVAVQDEGNGVPDELRDKLFLPFFTTKSPDEGTGLGLYLSREIVADFGGELALAPCERGARFVVRLPAVAHSPS